MCKMAIVISCSPRCPSWLKWQPMSCVSSFLLMFSRCPSSLSERKSPVWPTYCLLLVMQYIRLLDLQVTFTLLVYSLPMYELVIFSDPAVTFPTAISVFAIWQYQTCQPAWEFWLALTSQSLRFGGLQ